MHLSWKFQSIYIPLPLHFQIYLHCHSSTLLLLIVVLALLNTTSSNQVLGLAALIRFPYSTSIIVVTVVTTLRVCVNVKRKEIKENGKGCDVPLSK